MAAFCLAWSHWPVSSNVMPPSPRSVLACSPAVFQGWKYGCAPPGTSATLTWAAVLTEGAEPAEPPEPLSGLLVLQPAVTTRAAMPSADRATRAARVVFIIGLQDLVSYRMLRASYGSNPIGSRAGGLVPGPRLAHNGRPGGRQSRRG